MSEGGGFRIDPAALRQTSAKLHEHGEKVSEHGRHLKARTGGRVGHGPIGQVVDRFVTTAMTAVGEGFTKAASDLGHGFGKGLEDVAKRAEKADGEAAKGFKSLDHPHPVHAPNLKDEPPVAVVAPLGKSGPGSRFMNPVEGGRVPAYTKKLGTRGILHLPGQEPLALASGKQGPSMAVRNKGINGFTGNQLLHVEGHTSAQMRITGTMEADLEINRIPCIDGKGGGCDGLLPKMLPEGAKLRIYGPGGYYNEYVGLPDR